MKTTTTNEPTIDAVRLFGTGDTWRSRNKHVFPTDAALRWLTEKYRDDLIQADAMAIYGGCLFGLEPAFTECIKAFAKQTLLDRRTVPQRAAQAAADAAVSDRATTELTR